MKRNARMNVLFGVSFALVSAFLFWRVRYGLPGPDELFYLVIPYRMTLGDCLIQHEWTQPQLAAFLTWPIMWVYMKLCHSLDGVVLAFRYSYCCFWTLSTFFVWRNLKTVSRAGAFSGAMALLLFVPYGINALSYNSLGLMFMTLSVSFVVRWAYFSGLHNMFLAGFFFAGAVLCCPYLPVVLLCGVVLLLAVDKRLNNTF